MPLYQTQEFARRAGVSVRTLHHYDRLGILCPRRRTEAGYRLYDEGDLERLEQIVALKFLGLPLQQIRRVLDRETGSLAAILRRQREVLEEKRRLLDGAIQAIRTAEQACAGGGHPDAALLTDIIEVLEMQTNPNWLMKYYSPEAAAKVEDRRKLWNPELQAQVEKDWKELFAEIEASLGEDPASQKAQALAERWRKLVESFTGGDTGIAEGLNKLYADRANWPSVHQRQMESFSNPQVWEFIGKAMAAGRAR